ncbi:MAG: hybrid sensor histidine kinase/response regulator [Actinomycetota bacterium]
MALAMRPDTTRMVVTAYADLNATTDAINRGQVSRYIMKPWQEDDLAATIRTAIEFYELGLLIRQMESRMLGAERAATVSLILRQLAHELRNPLTSVKTNVEHTRNMAHRAADPSNPFGSGQPTGPEPPEPPKPNDPSLLPLAQITEAAGDALHAVRQIEAILVRAVSEGRASIPPAGPVDLARIVETAVRICRAEIREKSRLEVDLRAARCVRADPTALGQILINLLMNACQAIPAGDAEHHCVTIALSEADQKAHIEIRDTGVGIPHENLPHVFETHFSTKNPPVGAGGLGLSIVKELVLKMGGTIRVHSEVAVGTTFFVDLPAVPL